MQEMIRLMQSQTQSNSVTKYPSSTNTEPLPPPISNPVSERNYTVIWIIINIAAFTRDKQFCAAFMTVTIVTVLFTYRLKVVFIPSCFLPTHPGCG